MNQWISGKDESMSPYSSAMGVSAFKSFESAENGVNGRSLRMASTSVANVIVKTRVSYHSSKNSSKGTDQAFPYSAMMTCSRRIEKPIDAFSCEFGKYRMNSAASNTIPQLSLCTNKITTVIRKKRVQALCADCKNVKKHCKNESESKAKAISKCTAWEVIYVNKHK